MLGLEAGGGPDPANRDPAMLNRPPIPVERWGTTGTPERAILSLAVFGGLELRFEVLRETKEIGSAS